MEFIQSWFLGMVCSHLASQPSSKVILKTLLALRLQNRRIKNMADTALCAYLMELTQPNLEIVVERDLQGIFIREYAMNEHFYVLRMQLFNVDRTDITSPSLWSAYRELMTRSRVHETACYGFQRFQLSTHEVDFYLVLREYVRFAQQFDDINTNLYEAARDGGEWQGITFSAIGE